MTRPVIDPSAVYLSVAQSVPLGYAVAVVAVVAVVVVALVLALLCVASRRPRHDALGRRR